MNLSLENNEQLNIANVEASVEETLNDDWFWFPVRHHSPATAWHLRSAMLARKPKLVLIEGPSQSNDLIPLLRNSKTKPPVAIYSSFEDDTNQFGWSGILSPSAEIPARWACWYPVLEYSPELVAIKTAHKLNADVRFIDLPHYARITNISALDEEDDSKTAENDSDTDHEKVLNERHLAEKLISGSNFYQSLASAGGYKSWDEGWDSLFEFRDFPDYEAYRHELLTFCAAARQTASPTDADFLETIQRERFMLKSIREAIKQTGVSPEEVMIVCGGFHCSLDRNDPSPPPDIPSGTVYTTIVPYSFFRVSDISGYGAGNRAPKFYGSHWDALLGKNQNPIAEYTVSVLQRARKHGEAVSAADAISVTQHARMLASLRNRPKPILDDLHDAIFTCCCKGDPSQQGRGLQKAIDEIDIGNSVGKVPKDAPRLPVVADFYSQIDRLGLSTHVEQEKNEHVEIDRREDQGLALGNFFHRLLFAKIPFCQMAEQPETEFGTGLIFREKWILKWSPTVDSRLIELNLLGDSIETVAVNELKRQIKLNEGNAGEICKLLVAAAKMDLPNLLEQVFDLAMDSIEEDSRFVSITSALGQIKILDRYALHHELRRGQIQEMFERAYMRSCFAMQDIIAAPDENHGAIVDGLMSLADVILNGDADDHQRQTAIQAIESAFAATEVPFLRGALLGILVETKVRSNDVVAKEISGLARASQETMSQAGNFVHGVISVSRTSIMTGSAKLVEAIDELLRNSDWDVFTIILPRLRAAMELLHGRQRDDLASRVAEIYGLAESQSLKQLEVSVGLAEEIVKLDAEVAEIMSRWSFAK